jgi:tetraacyldisaccharide 4'-kinase
MLARFVERLWESPSGPARLVRGGLAPAAALYGYAVQLRNRAYDRGGRTIERVSARVIGVGNLTVGGSGKTPATLWVAEGLARRGRRVAIVARGYGKEQPGVVVVGRGEGPLVSARVGGDEAVMLAHRFRGPVITAERRAAGARMAIDAFGVDTIVLDDGFQHRALARDVDLLLLPPAGVVPALLPAGPFREPWSSAARAAVWIAVGECAVPPAPLARPTFPAKIGAQVLLRWNGSGWTEAPLAELARRSVVVVAGIARPARVATTVVGLGARSVELLAFPDHHVFTQRDVERIRRAARDADLVCTEKDAVKLTGLTGLPPWSALRVGLDVTRGELLLDQLAAPRPQLDFPVDCR